MNKAVNNPEQIAYVRRYTLSEGSADGIKVVEINNGIIRALINESKAMDIMQLFHRGTNISYLSKNGFTKRETDFVKRFEGGMLYTCGLDVLGEQIGYENHGSFHNIPSQITRCDCTEDRIIVEGSMCDTELFGKNLVVKRRYETIIGSDTITLKDTICNKGYRDEEFCLLYHVNVGYPMLDKGASVEAEVNGILSRNDCAKKQIDKAFIMEEPQDCKEETCYFLDLPTHKIGVINTQLKRRFTLKYSDNLPYFVQWKSMASGDYALGLEPTTSLLDNAFRCATIKAGESLQFGISIIVADITEKD